LLVPIGDSRIVLASSDDGEDWEDDDAADTKQGKVSEDDEPGWVMGTITKTVQYHMERSQQKTMKLDELAHPGWDDSADYFHALAKMFRTSETRVPAGAQRRQNEDTSAPPPATFGQLMENIGIVSGMSQTPQWTFRPVSSHL
jgi:hypothetical protein